MLLLRSQLLQVPRVGNHVHRMPLEQRDGGVSHGQQIADGDAVGLGDVVDLEEGVGHGLYHNFAMIQDSGIDIKLPLILSEGGAKSDLWRQIIADILNVDCAWAKESKGAPLGNAINAGVGVGVYDSYAIAKEWNKDTDTAEVTKPNTLSGICDGIDCVISSIGITRQKDGLTYMAISAPILTGRIPFS